MMILHENGCSHRRVNKKLFQAKFIHATYLLHVACVAASSTMYRPSLFSLERSTPGFVNDANGHIKCLDLDVQHNRQNAAASVLCSGIKSSLC